MARYIDADKLKERLENIKRPSDEIFGMGITRGIERAETTVDMMPTADVVEVKHGEWDYIATHDCFSCNICKFDSDVVMKYCGGCGAIMDGGKAE